MPAKQIDVEEFLKWVEIAHHPHGEEIAKACRDQFDATKPEAEDFFSVYRGVRDRVFHQYDAVISAQGDVPCNT
jgi:hypothetical protein